MQQFVCGMYVDLWHVLRVELCIHVLLLLGLRGEDILRVLSGTDNTLLFGRGCGPGVL